MWGALLTLWTGTACAVPVPVPEWLARVTAAVDEAMATVESGRRIKAGAAEVPIEAMRLPASGPPVVYRAGKRPVIGFDPKRAEGLTAVEFELALARERARAAADLGVRLIESEQAAEQAMIEYALDRAKISEEFGGLLRRAAASVRARQKIKEEDLGVPAGDAAIPLAGRDPALQAQLLFRFAADPEEFYWTVERELLRAPDAVGLSELETFLWAYAERLDQVECPAQGRYCRVGGRLVRSSLVGAARATMVGGGLERLRDELAGFQGEAAAKLRARAQAWLGPGN